MLIKLQGNARLILATLADRSPHSRHHVSLNELADDTGLSERTVSRYVRTLMALKLINARRRDGRGNKYSFDIYPSAYEALLTTHDEFPRLS